ncbi:MAG: efflux RND transporter periplasmic adaptor subunit [Dysgonamonadaceae bacterium]|jgi:membrane fusion protein (multidrug efflux system)|nr:efflux RND transporter periplasmic adaptor subunit [Dysgonamonadaceae bacterium]
MKTYNLFKFTPLVALLLLSSCGGKDTSSNTREVSQKRKVRVEEVRLISVDQLANFTATVEADVKNNIAPAMGGRIRNIYVEVGSLVRKGQKLVVMDETNLSQQQTQLATLKRDYERYLELYKVGGISKQQIDQLESQIRVMETLVNNLIENTTLISPINGVVTARNYDPGDVALQLPILVVESINPVKVLINVSESFFNQVKQGLPAEIKADALGDEVFIGKVSVIYPTIDPVSHTFPVEITVSNPNQRLRPGMFSRVTLNFGTKNHPVIPDMAVMKQVGADERYVFVEKDGKAVYTKVELGVRINDKYEIVSGLKEGDRVIVEGGTGLINGAEVEVESVQ